MKRRKERMYMETVAKTEKKERKAKITINEDYCKGCGLCVITCPLRLIRIANHISSKGYYPAEFVDPECKCTGCALCATMCPDVAIEVFKTKKSGGGK
jgi:2-oxoglutarate ferredoxin oxidoreductase subunit delta